MSKDRNLVVCEESLFVTLCYFASIIEITTGPTRRSYDFLKELYKEGNDHDFPEDEIERMSIKDVTSRMLYDMLDAWENAIDWNAVKEEDKKVWFDMSRCQKLRAFIGVCPDTGSEFLNVFSIFEDAPEGLFHGFLVQHFLIEL